jgi:hypothetical protein
METSAFDIMEMTILFIANGLSSYKKNDIINPGDER